MIIDIVGTGISASSYRWLGENQRWSVASAFESYGVNIDLYFAMHKGEQITFKNVLSLDNYPIDDIIKKYGSKYFTCSISYMLAYALYKKTELNISEINLFGIDMEAETEYAFERGSVGYWIGFLRGSGLVVNVHSPFTNNVFLYGYDNEKMSILAGLLSDRESAYIRNAESADGDAKQQWIGASFAMKKLKSILRG